MFSFLICRPCANDNINNVFDNLISIFSFQQLHFIWFSLFNCQLLGYTVRIGYRPISLKAIIIGVSTETIFSCFNFPDLLLMKDVELCRSGHEVWTNKIHKADAESQTMVLCLEGA